MASLLSLPARPACSLAVPALTTPRASLQPRATPARSVQAGSGAAVLASPPPPPPPLAAPPALYQGVANAGAAKAANSVFKVGATLLTRVKPGHYHVRLVYKYQLLLSSVDEARKLNETPLARGQANGKLPFIRNVQAWSALDLTDNATRHEAATATHRPAGPSCAIPLVLPSDARISAAHAVHTDSGSQPCRWPRH